MRIGAHLAEVHIVPLGLLPDGHLIKCTLRPGDHPMKCTLLLLLDLRTSLCVPFFHRQGRGRRGNPCRLVWDRIRLARHLAGWPFVRPRARPAWAMAVAFGTSAAPCAHPEEAQGNSAVQAEVRTINPSPAIQDDTAASAVNCRPCRQPCSWTTFASMPSQKSAQDCISGRRFSTALALR